MKFSTVFTAIIVASTSVEGGLLLHKLGSWGGNGGVVATTTCDTPTPAPEPPCDTPTPEPCVENSGCVVSSGSGGYSGSYSGGIGGIIGKKISFIKGLLGH